MKSQQFTILLVAVLALGAYSFVSQNETSKKLEVIESEIEHVDDEVDEAASGVKRLLAKQSLSSNNTPNEARAAVSSREHDFGVIQEADGAVTTTFAVHNRGSDTLVLGEISTSCSCTSAAADKTTVAPNESSTVTVTFDPNVHEEPEGRFSRTVYIPTNDTENAEIEFKIFVEIEN